MGDQQFSDGVAVIVTDAEGVEHQAVARSGVEGRNVSGVFTHDVPVVRVEVARADGQGTGVVPWPLSAVRLAEGT